MKNWTPSEIATLTTGFLHGTPLKELSRKMDRTVSALNKALTRFGIRPDITPKTRTGIDTFGEFVVTAGKRRASIPANLIQPQHHSELIVFSKDTEESPDNDSPVFDATKAALLSSALSTPLSVRLPHSAIPTLCMKTTLREFERQQKARLNGQKTTWVPLHTVIRYMEHNGQKITVHKRAKRSIDTLYTLNGQTMNADRLVFMANRIRFDANQAPFYVEGITR